MCAVISPEADPNKPAIHSYIRKRPTVRAWEFKKEATNKPDCVSALASGDFIAETNEGPVRLKEHDMIIWFPDGRISVMNRILFCNLYEVAQ